MVWQTASKAEKLAKEEERRQAELRSYKGVMTVSESRTVHGRDGHRTCCMQVLRAEYNMHDDVKYAAVWSVQV